MSEKYILRHKLKNPTYKTDSEHQWFNIIDILQKTENNKIENEIQIHGILKDRDSVSTENINNSAINTDKIKDGAVTAKKTSFQIAGNADGFIDNNKETYLNIASGSISYNDLSSAAKTILGMVGSNSVGTDQLKLNAVTNEKINAGAVSWDKLSTDIDWSKKLPENTIDKNGLVLAGNNNGSKVWATDDDGNPGWRKVSNQFDTKLFGAYIGWHKPTTIIIEEESSEKKYTLSESIEDTDKEDIIKATLIGFYQYDTKYETMSVRLRESFDITRWIIDGPAGGNESTEPSTGDDPAGAPSIEPYSNSFVIENIESDSFPIQIEDKILDLNWALDQWIGPEPNENYLIKNMTYYDNLMQYSSDEDKKDFMNGLCREFLTVISDNKNNQDASFSSLEDWKGKSGNTLIECLSDWDYDHCGIWIET